MKSSQFIIILVLSLMIIMTVGLPAFSACTIFMASYGDTVLFANNEDYINPKTYYWVIPSGEGIYGGLYLGFDDLAPQGGINEKGLCFDINSVPEAPLNFNPERLIPSKWVVSIIMEECATIEEAISKAKQYNWGHSIKYQIFMADATGDAVVISLGPNGELAFTRKEKGEGYLISTNFNRANPDSGGYPCWRYETTEKMLKKIKSEEGLTVEYFKSILDAVHRESTSLNTVYSNIFDFKEGIIYLYHFHQFDEVVVLNLAEQLARGSWCNRIGDLFSQQTVDNAFIEHWRYQGKIFINSNSFFLTIILTWFFLVLGSLIFLIWKLTQRKSVSRGAKILWIVATIYLGPFGLLSYLLSYRHLEYSPDSKIVMVSPLRAFGSTVFDIAGFALGINIALLIVFLFSSYIEAGGPLGITIIFGLAFIVGLFIFHAPLIAYFIDKPYWATIKQRLLAEILSMNFVWVGLAPVSALLIILLNRYSIFTSSLKGMEILVFWGITSLSALAGMVTAYPYNLWTSFCGYSIWPFLVLGKKEIIEGEERKLVLSLKDSWRVLLLSFFFLIASIAIIIMIVS